MVRRTAGSCGSGACGGGAAGSPYRRELGELFERRFGVLGPPQLDTLGCIALGEPLPAEAVDVLAPPEVVSELEEVDLLRSYSDGFDVWVRVSHPLLAAAVVERLSPARRRRLAGRLLGAAAESPGTIDVVRRAVWQLDSDQPVDTTVLCEASRRVQLTDPRLAARLARRALDVDHSVQSALTFAEACIELGDLDGARAGLAAAQAGAADEADVVAVGTARASFRAWSERDPRGAAEALATLGRQATSREQKRDVASLEALVRLFSAQTGDAVALGRTGAGRRSDCRTRRCPRRAHDGLRAHARRAHRRRRRRGSAVGVRARRRRGAACLRQRDGRGHRGIRRAVARTRPVP